MSPLVVPAKAGHGFNGFSSFIETVFSVFDFKSPFAAAVDVLVGFEFGFETVLFLPHVFCTGLMLVFDIFLFTA